MRWAYARLQKQIGCGGADYRWGRGTTVIWLCSVLSGRWLCIGWGEDFLPAKGKWNGFFGFHIHRGGDCSGAGFSGTEGHYNPLGRGHSEYAGDLPPLLWCKGNAYLSVKTDRFSVDEIVGRIVVIHSDPDDFHIQPAGNAGKKVACGVICKRFWTSSLNAAYSRRRYLFATNALLCGNR